MAKTVSARTEIEEEDHKILQARKNKTGISIDFQVKEAIKMYVQKIKKQS